jgi:hypothetical protein
MECKRYSLDGLSGAHGVNEKLQWGKVTILDELDGGMVLKAPIGGVEKDTGVGLVAGVEVNERNPDSIETAEFPLQAAGVGRLADPRGLPANGTAMIATGTLNSRAIRAASKRPVWGLNRAGSIAGIVWAADMRHLYQVGYSFLEVASR